MTGKRPKNKGQPADERVRYEVYGMPIEGIIEGAMAPEREAAEAEAKAKEEAEAADRTGEPAWPSLEDLKTNGPRARPRSPRPRR